MRWSDITLCYLMLLNRLPTDREVTEGRSSSVANLLESLVSQREFARRALMDYFGADPQGKHTLETQRFYDYVGELGEARLAVLLDRIKAIPSKPHDGHDYVAFHSLRMVELMGFLERWNKDHPIRSILDVGLSPFFKLYQELFPEAEAFLVDYHAPPAAYLQSIGAKGAYQIDLNKNWVSSSHGGPVNRSFDIIVFTEVVEHLLIDPAEALRDLLAVLNPGGIIYFSTPNYLNITALERLLDRSNPQQRYTKADGNRGNHYHLREYSFSELADAVRQAGGELAFQAFSDCWDKDALSAEVLEELPVAMRSNLLLLVRKASEASKGEPPLTISDGTMAISREAAADLVTGLTVDLDQLLDIDVKHAGENLDRLTFDEHWYLRNNRDVADAVREGHCKSGWEHYVNYGRQEGRPFRRRMIRIVDR